jgi:hypothetical protein
MMKSSVGLRGDFNPPRQVAQFGRRENRVALESSQLPVVAGWLDDCRGNCGKPDFMLCMSFSSWTM